MWIHPKLDKGIGKAHPDLTRIEQAFGFWVSEADFKKFSAEAETAVPHLSSEEKRIWAIYNAQRHPSCALKPKVTVRGNTALPYSETRLMLVLQVIILAMLMLLFATHGHANDKKQKDAPVTVIPLDDANKVKILTILRKQDAAIEKKQSLQLQIDALDKEIQNEQDAINQAAQQMAISDKIDTSTMVMDLDKLAWIAKELK